MNITLKAQTSFMGEIVQPLVKPSVPVQFEGQTYDMSRKAEDISLKFGQLIMPVGAAIGALNMTARAFAEVVQPAIPAMAATSSIGAKLMPLVWMIQDFAFPVGIGVATWGLVEVILGNVGSGKQKIKYSIIGYIGIFVLPFVFEAIKSAFRGA